MARVTVEDCIDKVENRFELVLLASHRARMVSSGSQITVDRDNDKNPVVALREIAETTISPGGPEGRPDPLAAEVCRGRRAGARGVPLIAGAGGSVDADDTEVAVDHMSEEELLKGLEGPGAAGGAAGAGRANKALISVGNRERPGSAGPFSFCQPCARLGLAEASNPRDIIDRVARRRNPGFLAVRGRESRSMARSKPAIAADAEPGAHPRAAGAQRECRVASR